MNKADEIYSAEKERKKKKNQNKDFLKFTSKRMKLEKTNLSEVTEIQKDKHGMYSLISRIRHKAKNIQSTVHNPREARTQG